MSVSHPGYQYTNERIALNSDARHVCAVGVATVNTQRLEKTLHLSLLQRRQLLAQSTRLFAVDVGLDIT